MHPALTARWMILATSHALREGKEGVGWRVIEMGGMDKEGSGDEDVCVCGGGEGSD